MNEALVVLAIVGICILTTVSIGALIVGSLKRSA